MTKTKTTFTSRISLVRIASDWLNRGLIARERMGEMEKKFSEDYEQESSFAKKHKKGRSNGRILTELRKELLDREGQKNGVEEMDLLQKMIIINKEKSKSNNEI